MGVLKVTGCGFGFAFAGIGVLLGVAGCGSSSSNDSGKVAAAAKPAAARTPARGAACPARAGPCTSYTTPLGDSGTTIQLGPYGASAEANVGKGFENQLQMGDTPGSTYCKTFIDGVFDLDPAFSAQVDQILSGTANGVTARLCPLHRVPARHVADRPGARHHLGQRDLRAARELRRAAPLRGLVRVLRRRGQLA